MAIRQNESTRSLGSERVLRNFTERGYGVPTMVAPRKLKTWPIGFAIAVLLLPAKSKPIALGLVATSWTMSEPESPPARNRLPLFLTTIWPVKVFVKAVPPAHSFS